MSKLFPLALTLCGQALVVACAMNDAQSVPSLEAAPAMDPVTVVAVDSATLAERTKADSAKPPRIEVPAVPGRNKRDSLALVSAIRAGMKDKRWPVHGPFDAIFCANLLHIAPWSACAGLMAGAARHLAPGGVLVTYGPYLEDEVVTAPSNLAFDASLRQRNPAWGLRRREDVEAQARHGGLALRKKGEGFAVTAIRPDGVDRPWSSAPSAEITAPATKARLRIAPPVDATPSEADRQSDD